MAREAVKVLEAVSARGNDKSDDKCGGIASFRGEAGAVAGVGGSEMGSWIGGFEL